MGIECGALLARLIKAPRKTPSAVCLVRVHAREEASGLLHASGMEPVKNLGWAPLSSLAEVGTAESFLREPSVALAPLSVAFSFAASGVGHAQPVFEAWVEPRASCLVHHTPLPFATRSTRPLRFVRTLADAQEFLLRTGLPWLPLDVDPAHAFREGWRRRHLLPAALDKRLPGRPRGRQRTRWTYDCDDLIRSEDLTPQEAAERLRGLRVERFALFFEAVDLPVLELHRRHLESCALDWECDVYLTALPRGRPTAAWTHAGPPIRWSDPGATTRRE